MKNVVAAAKMSDKRNAVENFDWAALPKEHKCPLLHCLWLRSFRAPFKYLFVFAHMRSGSSLVVHLLNSHPSILGYGETRIKYDNADSLSHLVSKVSLFFEKNRVAETYVMDKVPHDDLFVETNLLKREDVHCLFLLRNAEKTLPSITDMYINVFPKIFPGYNAGEVEALNYYSKRLEKMVELAQAADSKERSMFITYDQLLDRTDDVFVALHEWLNIENTFSETYETHRATGLPLVGDFSEAIRSGKIQRDNKTTDHEINSELLEQGTIVYNRSCEKLRVLCNSIN